MLAGIKERANFMPETAIVMYRKLGKSRVENPRIKSLKSVEVNGY